MYQRISDEELLSLPPPTGFILCSLLNIPTKKGENGYLKCKRCQDHIPCVRYIEATQRRGGYACKTRSVFDKEEESKQMERYLDSVGYTSQ